MAAAGGGGAVNLTEAELRALLDFSTPVDVPSLDRIIHAFHTPNHPAQKAADQCLVQFREVRGTTCGCGRTMVLDSKLRFLFSSLACCMSTHSSHLDTPSPPTHPARAPFLFHPPSFPLRSRILPGTPHHTTPQQHPSAWASVAGILEKSAQVLTRFYALQVLEETIRVRWKALPPAEKESVKGYIVNKIIELSSDATRFNPPSAAQRRGGGGTSALLKKFNQCLVEILKHDWPAKWPTFITDITKASMQSELICENNMSILKMLSEEVFEFSGESLTSAKARELKERMASEFKSVFELVQFVLAKSRQVRLASCCSSCSRFAIRVPSMLYAPLSVCLSVCLSV